MSQNAELLYVTLSAGERHSLWARWAYEFLPVQSVLTKPASVMPLGQGLGGLQLQSPTASNPVQRIFPL